VGPYPVLACPRWDRLAEDLAELRDVVSVVAVPDALAGLDAAALRPAFPDLVRRYKRHYVVDLDVPAERRLSPNHHRNLRRLPRDLRTERVGDPPAHLDTWCRLYSVLVARHDIRGAAEFSRESFEAQLRVPGLCAWRAVLGGETVGMVLWYVTGLVAHYHLTAASEAGYRSRCVYGLLRHALADLAADGVRRADLGGPAGLDDDDTGGLASFKRGWSTGTVEAMICGRIVDRDAYADLTRASGTRESGYFPAYRAPSAPPATSHVPRQRHTPV
jgi:hypothetical protein